MLRILCKSIPAAAFGHGRFHVSSSSFNMMMGTWASSTLHKRVILLFVRIIVFYQIAINISGLKDLFKIGISSEVPCHGHFTLFIMFKTWVLQWQGGNGSCCHLSGMHVQGTLGPKGCKEYG
ncbi:hypothetical protein GOP47_0030462 [Adiantum capillus-veneris]|nr:hypothetical protein GOP47_0030462 [Adiantum capillus-veneris]